jgi:hypothetical protein
MPLALLDTQEAGMRRRLVLLVGMLGIVLTGLGVAAQEGFSLIGRLGATDQEAQEGYFAIDSQTMIVVKPGSEMHAFLRGKVGQRIRLTVEPDPES